MTAIQGSATCSPCGLHRHVLSRWWSDEPRALVCGCNPSRAGATTTDPTVCRLVALLRGREGIGGFDLVNFGDRVETDPDALHAWRARAWSIDPAAYEVASGQNHGRIGLLARRAAARIVAWGELLPQAPFEIERLAAAMSDGGVYGLYAFALTRSGAPRHPLARGRERIPLSQPLVVWRSARSAVTRPTLPQEARS